MTPRKYGFKGIKSIVKIRFTETQPPTTWNLAASTALSVRRLGFVRWKRLHRMAYVATALGVVHFTSRVKKDLREPVVYGLVLAALLLVRVGVELQARWLE